MALRIGRTHALILTLTTAALLAGCKKFDNKELEDTIQKGATTQGISFASVTCPPNQPMRENTKFTCACVDKVGTQGTVDVLAVNNHGRIEWKLRNKFMNMRVVGDSLEDKLSKRLNKVVDVVCPSDNILVRKDVSFSCDITVGAEKARITLTAKADDGSSWDEKITKS